MLEWNNPGCPYVKKHYDSGNMQKTQAAAEKDGVVWLTINSSAPGKQGHMNGSEAKAFVAAKKAQPTAYLLDPRAWSARRYGADDHAAHVHHQSSRARWSMPAVSTTRPTANKDDIAGARNHVLAALGRDEGREDRFGRDEPALWLLDQIFGQLRPDYRGSVAPSLRRPRPGR